MSMPTTDDIPTIDELVRRQARVLKRSTLIGYPKDGLLDYEEHSAQDIDRYVDAAAEVIQARGLMQVVCKAATLQKSSLISLMQASDLEKAPVVGILAHSGLHMIITILGLSRLGYAVLLLSTRLASPAIIRLLDLCECNVILTSSGLRPLLDDVNQQREVGVLNLLARSDYNRLDAPAFSRSYDQRRENTKLAIVIHSSGSTGLPKPIYLTHQSCIAAFATNLNMRALCTSPLFHSQGFYETFRSIFSGQPIYYCNYSLPLTKQNLVGMIGYVKPDLLHCVPYVLKMLSESQEGVRCLRTIKTVLFGGSACPDDLGDRLVQNGVNLVANYGATETGRLMNSVRPPGDLAWNYLRILPSAKPYVLMDEIGPNIFECVALDGLKSKSTINSDSPPRSFRTRDLFAKHPTRPDLWKYLSRTDDRLTLTLGEKVLPIPIEGRIRQEAFVKEAIVFGEGRTTPGVILIKNEVVKHMPDSQYLESVWNAIEDANSRAEAFSRIPKELVIVLPVDTAYPRTDKGTFIRAQAYEQFKGQIDGIYAKFEHDEDGTLVLESHELENYLIKMFHRNLDIDLPTTETDFFSFGIDSLQCIRMWALIRKELDLNGRQAELSQNILYETGNVKALSRFLHGLRTGSTDMVGNEQQVMQSMIAKYTEFETIVRTKTKTTDKESVLLTGVTGGLGAHLLAQLVTKSRVSRVYAFVRASSHEEAVRRIHRGLLARGIHLDFFQKEKIQAIAADLSEANFGLDSSQLEGIRSCLTLVIHSAWAVNFNISVGSFENQHIRAVYNLIQLCRTTYLAEPARFFFCSSVSAAGGTPRPGVVKELPVQDILHVQRTGYARSKYVAENITVNAMRFAGLESRVLRIGQLVGDSRLGEWNTSEGVPLMIETARTLGALPALDEEMSWLPVDYAASIILDLTRITDSGTQVDSSRRGHEADSDLVYHVINPTRFHWTRDMLPVLRASGLAFEVLPTEKWMNRLRLSVRDPKLNPPIKLLDWFESKYGHGASRSPNAALYFSTEKTQAASGLVARLPDVTNIDYVKRIVERLERNWKRAD